MNRAIVIGNLGDAPQMKFLDGGQAVANFSVATSERWVDKQSGEKKERTEWHRVVVWGNQAELCAECLHKGSKVAVDGRIQTRKWTDNNGVEKYTTEIVAQSVEFLTPREKQRNPNPGPDVDPWDQ